MAGSRTVFEFTGSEAAKDHRGSRGTFIGATLDLSNAKEERAHNLGSGSSTWIFAGVAVLLLGGLAAYFALGDDGKAEEPAAVAAAPDEKAEPPAADAKAAGSGDETGGSGSGDETGAATGEPAADAKAPVDDAKAVPAETPKPTEPVVEPKPATTKPSGTKSTGTKPTTTKPKPKPEPKEDPKPSGSKLKPKKPPRDPLGNLPPPPG